MHNSNISASELEPLPTLNLDMDLLLKTAAPVLEQIVAGLPLSTLLEQIIDRFETRSEGMARACVRLLDRDGRRLVPVAARGLPSTYLDSVGSIAIGEGGGSCGAAAATGAPVYIGDIASDPRWRDLAQTTLAYGLRACWATPVRGLGGAVIGTFASYYDHPREPLQHEIEAITVAARTVGLAIERHLSDDRLREQEGRQRQVVNSALDFAIIGTDLAGVVTNWSEGAHRVFGWSEEEMCGQPIHRIFTQEDIVQGRPEQEMELALRAGHASDSRWHVHRDGGRLWVSGEMTTLSNEMNEVIGYVKAVRDCTEQKLAETQLRRLNEALESEVAQRTRERDRVWRNSPDLLMVLSNNGALLAVNPAWTRILAFDTATLTGRHFHAFLHPDDASSALLALARATEQPSLQFEARIRTAAGDWRRFAWTAAPEEGLIYGSGRDVTNEKRQAEKLLLANEMRLRLALDAGEMAAWQWDMGAARSVWLYGMDALHGLTPEQSRAACTLRGYSRHVHPEDRPLFHSAMKRALRSGGDLHAEYRIVRDGGQVRWLESRARTLFDDCGQPTQLSGVCMDITRRKRTEQDLRFLAHASAEFATLVDYQSMLQRLARLAVPAFADWCVVDLLREDGRLDRVAVAHADPEKARLAKVLHRRLPPDPCMPNGIWNILRTGRAEVISDMRDNATALGIKDTERLGALRRLGLRSYLGVPLSTHGRTLGVITFISAESGRIYSEEDLALAGDLAQRAAVAMENATLYEALQQSGRAKDVFLATLAHELRNPLAPISNAVALLRLRQQPETKPGPGQALQVIERQVSQLSRLVDDLLDVSRINTGKIELKRELSDLVTILQSAIETSRPHIEAAQHTLAVTLGAAQAPLDADPLRLAQVFSNLLNNAAKYTNRGGRIDIAMEVAAQEYVVRVRDNGIGIAEPMLKDVFTLFTQVTHPVERSQGGLGIGLSLVEGLVHLHGGRVEAFSAGSGQGSEFTVRLPRAAEATPARTASAAAATEVPGLGAQCARRILVVDDNLDAAGTVAELLRLLGNEVRVVHDGLSAVDEAAEMMPDIVLLDIGLPGIDGYEAARRIRAHAGSAVRLIALTGWSQDKDREQARAAGFDEHWVKPVSLEKLQALAAHRAGA
jgi:PAS domain S-box-containing protein